MINTAIILGNLGADPEIRQSQNGSSVANFNVATTEKWKDKEGNDQEATEWHRIVVWGKQAEIAGEYLGKGRQIYVEGRLQTKTWKDKEGNDRTTTEINCQRFLMLGKKSDAPQAMGSGGGGGSDLTGPDKDYPDDDIPF